MLGACLRLSNVMCIYQTKQCEVYQGMWGMCIKNMRLLSDKGMWACVWEEGMWGSYQSKEFKARVSDEPVKGS